VQHKYRAFELAALRRRDTGTTAPVQLYAEDDHHGPLDCTDESVRIRASCSSATGLFRAGMMLLIGEGGLASRPKRGSMSGGPITAGCASAQVGLGGDHERRRSRP
jgi:hypothetical protein